MNDSWLLRLSNLPACAGSRARRSRTSLAGIRGFILMAVGALPLARGATDEEIALVASMGQKGSLGAEEIYRLYSERVFRFIYCRSGEQTQDAEELTLDTFITAISLCKGFNGRSSVFGWLCGIARVRMIDLHRRNSRNKRNSGSPAVSLQDIDEAALECGGSVECLIDRIGASQLMDAAFQTLSMDERESLLLLYVDGLSIREIGAQMKRSEDAIDSLTRRSKGKLRTALLTLMGEEDGND